MVRLLGLVFYTELIKFAS